MSKKETTSEGFSLEELLDFMTIPELKKMAIMLNFSFKSGVKKQTIVSFLAKILIEEPMRLIKACYIYELEMYKSVIEGNMSVEYAEKSGLLFDFNRFGLVYALENKSTKKESLHFPKELAQVLLPLIEPEINHRKTLGGDLVEKAVIGSTNIYGVTDLYNVLEITRKIEVRLGLEYNMETLNDVISPFYHQTCTKKDNTDPILSPFAKMVGFYPDDDHQTDEKPKEYDLDTLISFGQMPYPVIAIKETKTLEKILQEQGNPSEGTPQEIIRQLWLDKQDQSQCGRLPEFSKYFLFTDERKINEALQALTEFLNSVPCWRLNGNSSKDLMQKDFNSARRSGKMPQISMGPNMRAMGIDSFEQLLEMAERGEELPPFPDSYSTSAPKSSYSSSPKTRLYQPTVGEKKVGRNEPCPCGSGKKYKNCCGR